MINTSLQFRGTPTRYWSYEQAFAEDQIITFNRNSETDNIQRFLSNLADIQLDNKVTFEMSVSKEIQYYITFHDNTVYIGKSIRPYRGKVLSEGKTIML